ncbi:hypothetical protein [Flavobacterium sp. LB2P44]|uniref:hypothetical protein n=1 Tax=Flavobacterium sp. LB2P44 TaxID=3401713 RepID=UPI003AAE1293
MAKLGCPLLYIHKKLGQLNGVMDLDLSSKEITDFTGTTDEQLIRMISIFTTMSPLQYRVHCCENQL